MAPMQLLDYLDRPRKTVAVVGRPGGWRYIVRFCPLGHFTTVHETPPSGVMESDTLVADQETRLRVVAVAMFPGSAGA